MAFFHESGDHSPSAEEVDPVTFGGDAATLRLVVVRGELSDAGVKAAPPLMAEARRRAALVTDTLIVKYCLYGFFSALG